MNRKERRLLLLILLSTPNCSIKEFERLLNMHAHDEQQFVKLINSVYACWRDKLTNLSNESERTTLAIIAIRTQYDFLLLTPKERRRYNKTCLR